MLYFLLITWTTNLIFVNKLWCLISNLYCLRIKLVSSSMISLVVFQEQVRCESLSGEAYPCFTNKKGWFSLSITFSLSEILGSLSWNFCNSLPTFCCWPLSGIVLCLLTIFAVCFRISPLLNMTSLFFHLFHCEVKGRLWKDCLQCSAHLTATGALIWLLGGQGYSVPPVQRLLVGPRKIWGYLLMEMLGKAHRTAHTAFQTRIFYLQLQLYNLEEYLLI